MEGKKLNPEPQNIWETLACCLVLACIVIALWFSLTYAAACAFQVLLFPYLSIGKCFGCMVGFEFIVVCVWFFFDFIREAKERWNKVE